MTALLFLLLQIVSVACMPRDIFELEGVVPQFVEDNTTTVAVAGTQYGIDVSTTISSTSATCLASTYTFVVPRVLFLISY